jgi:hypothetical protein
MARLGVLEGSRAKLEAGERAWAREIAKEEGILEKEHMEEESIIEKKIAALRKVYGDKTPKELLIDHRTGKQYPHMQRRKILFDTGDRLAKFFASIAALINPLLERDLAAEAKLIHLFGSRAKNMGANLVTLKKMRDNAKAIKKALAEAEAYYVTVRDTSHKARLPYTTPFKNGQRITAPLDLIDKIALDLLGKIEKKLSKDKIRLVRRGAY